MKFVALLLGAAFLAVAGEPQEQPAAKSCPCEDDAKAEAVKPHALLQAKSFGEASVRLSKLVVHQDHQSSGGISLQEVAARYGGQSLSEVQRERALPGIVANTSLLCVDDRLTEAVLATPGGDLGEFLLALAAYLRESDGLEFKDATQERVTALLQRYLETIPASRPLTFCTDERAVHRLESVLPSENLDLTAPPERAKSIGLLDKLADIDNQGDSHFRLLLKRPDWYELHPELTPMVLKAFYTLLWQQNRETPAKLQLRVLAGESDPQAFMEVSCGGQCKQQAAAPMLRPKEGQQSVFVSHLDAASIRRQELASFFAKVSRSTPRKISQKTLHARLDRHGWSALETTGSRIAAGLPFFSMTYA